jgi:putative addiction module killer protein
MKAVPLVQLYQTKIFADWFSGLRDKSAQLIIGRRLDRLRLGNFGDSKLIGSNVIELRIFFGPGYRLYLKHSGETIVLLLCGGDKSTQSADIARAKMLAANEEINYESAGD